MSWLRSETPALAPPSQDPDGSDAELVAQARQGDPRAFALLYRRYLDRVYDYCRHRLPNRESAEDATQTIFVKALGAIGTSRDGDLFAARDGHRDRMDERTPPLARGLPQSRRPGAARLSPPGADRQGDRGRPRPQSRCDSRRTAPDAETAPGLPGTQPEGTYLFTFSEHGNGPGQLYGAGSLTIGADGTFIMAFGERGSEEGQFNGPADLALDQAGNIYVTEPENGRVQAFTPDGEFLVAWSAADDGEGAMMAPIGITVDAAGDVYVADVVGGTVQTFEVSLPVTPGATPAN